MPSGHMDDNKRGHYIPTNARSENQPVRPPRMAGIAPTQPGGRVEPLGPPRGGDNIANATRPIALGSGVNPSRAAPQRV